LLSVLLKQIDNVIIYYIIKLNGLYMEKLTTSEISTKLRVPISASPLPPLIEEVIRYPLLEPFVYVVIARDVTTGGYMYLVDELRLNEEEIGIYNTLMDTLQFELKVPRSEVDPKAYFETSAKGIIDKYWISMGRMKNVAWSKILYYVERDMGWVWSFRPFNARSSYKRHYCKRGGQTCLRIPLKI
jgi:hypothetical protein